MAEQVDALQREIDAKVYLARWKELLGLQNWSIELQIQALDPDEMDGLAMTTWAEHYRQAILKVSPVARIWNLELVVVHELLHIFLHRLEDWGTDEFRAGGLMRRAFYRALEETVDELTNVILRLHSTGPITDDA